MNGIISPHHQVLMPNLKPLFSNGVKMGFIGKPDPESGIENPGFPETDPDYAKKLRVIFGEDREIVYLTCDHSGGIVQASNSYLNPLAISQIIPTGLPGVIAVRGDAIAMLSYKDVSRKILEKLVLVIRTWDCGNIIVHNPEQGSVALIHASIKTAFGFDKNPEKYGQGQIIDKTLVGLCGGLRDTYLAIGPCISGVAGLSHRCYEFDDKDADRLFEMVKSRYFRLDTHDLRSNPDTNGKVKLAFGRLILRTITECLIPLGNIETSCNHCTFDTDGWYSHRRTLHEKKDQQWMEKTTERFEKQLKARYGNLAFISWH